MAADGGPISSSIPRAETSRRVPRTRLLVPVALAVVVLLTAASARASAPTNRSQHRTPVSRPTAATLPPGVSSLSPAAVRYIEMLDVRNRLAASGAPTISTFGDSTALITGVGLATVAETTFARTGRAAYANTLGSSLPGCGLITTGTRRVGLKLGSPPKGCDGWWDRWAATVAARPVDIAYVELGNWDILDQQPAGSPVSMHIGQPFMDALLRGRLEQAVKVLQAHARLIVFALPPDIDVGRVDGQSPVAAFPESGPTRMDLFRAMVSSVAAEHADVATVDLAGWLRARPDEHQMRPDGVHLTRPAAIEVATWLGPELVRIARSHGIVARRG